MTLVALMREAPQKWLPLTCRDACHGAKDVLVTSAPPTTLLSADATIQNKVAMKVV